MTKLRSSYFKWLYGKIQGDTRSYLLLCAYLNTIDFHWTVPNDGNREQDSIRQREIFVDEKCWGYHSDDIDRFYNQKVSLFEVFVALCERIDYNLDDMIHPPRTAEWFRELLNNLGIGWAVDDEFKYRLGAKREIDNAINVLLLRKYDWNGNGSFFPLRRRPDKSMVKTEIWYQMMAYLEENYS